MRKNKNLSNLKNVLLFITNKCNLKCEYCYIKQNNDVLNLETAKKVIDSIDDGTVVDFFGGEALLEIELLNEIVDYAKENNRNIVFQLFSNATRYDNEVKKLLAKGVNIGVSFDGISSFHRTHNNEITNLILNNLTLMKKDIKNLAVKVAITPDNVHEMLDNIKFLNEKGFNNISHFLLRENVWNEDKIKLYEEKLKETFEWYCEHVNQVSLIYFDSLLLENKRKSGCWAGCEGVAVNFNGELYPCQRFLTKKLPFIIGDVHKGITNNLFRKYDIRKFIECQNCEILHKCNNICIATQYEENNDLFAIIPCVCELTKATYRQLEILEKYKEILINRMKNKRF